MSWDIDQSFANANRFKSYYGKHPDETASCFNNAIKLSQALGSGIPFQSAKFGFLRSEGGGLFRIGQTGVPHAKETRLYFCVKDETIYVLDIGGKETQDKDIQRCKKLVQQINGETP